MSPISLFYNSSSAGNARFDYLSDGTDLRFYDTSTAANAKIVSYHRIEFYGSSNAANANISLYGLASGTSFLSFYDSSSAGGARISINANTWGAYVSFTGSSTGDTAQIELISGDQTYQATSDLDIDHNVTIGSLAGDEPSFVGLGGNLTVGSNNLNTAFAGCITNGGSLNKTGSGKLTLTNANPYQGSDYTGGTTINNGVLIVNNTTGSATGTGPVKITLGALNGTGIISGAVIVGNGTTTGAILRGGCWQCCGDAHCQQ